MKEYICERCWKGILQKDNLEYYLKIPNFLTENYYLFCRCNNKGITITKAESLEFEYNVKKNQKLFK